MILLYHKVYPEPKTEWWVTPDAFYLQMLDLRNKKVVYLDEYDPTDPQQCVITFDGVYENVWQYAAPILSYFGYPFELFINGEFIGKDNEFDIIEPRARFADERTLERLVTYGGRLQWHTWSHQDLTKPESQSTYEHELDVPARLRDLCPEGFQWFAPPYGRSDNSLEQYTRTRFAGSVLCDSGDDRDQYNLRRLTVVDKTRFSSTTVSVIIPCYNYGHFAAEAIESVLYQTYPPDEILFIDDASSDDSVSVAERYLSKIRIEVNPKNLGIVDNFNKAVRLTSGDYICFLGADNRFRSDYLEKTKTILDCHPDVGIAYTNLVLWGNRAPLIAIDMEAGIHPKVPGFYLKEYLAKPQHDIQQRNYLHGSSLYRRKAFEQIGGYIRGTQAEDHSLFARILAAGWKAELCNGYVLEYRQHSKDQSNLLKGLEITNVYLRTALQERGKTITWLQTELCERKKIIRARDEAIAWLQTELCERKKIIRARDEAIAWLQTELARIRNSLGWRLVCRCSQIKDRYLRPVYRQMHKLPSGVKTDSHPKQTGALRDSDQ